MKIELTEQEIKRIVPILERQYRKSVNLFEITDLKRILNKLGVTIKDWTPDLNDGE